MIGQIQFSEQIREASIRKTFQTKINNKNLIKNLDKEGWSDVFRCEDVNESAAAFVRKLKSHIDTCTDKIYYECRRVKRSSWITNGLVKSTIE